MWVVRLTPGNATVGDLEAFKQWSARSPLHAQAFVEARRLWAEAEVAGRNVEQQSASRVSYLSPKSMNPRVGRRAVLGGTIAAAAAASYLMVRPPLDLWQSLPDLLDADYRTDVGEQRHVKIADNVSVEMNTRSSIALRPGSKEMDRIELISGEGVITAKTRAFEVVSGGGRAWAADATFDVRRDDRACKVTCLDGTVQVACGKAVVSLVARQQVSYSDRGMGPVVVVDTDVVTAWRTGFLIFHDAPLREVITEVNRYRHGRIVLMNPNLGSRVVNARFRLDRMEDVVTKVTSAFGASATSLPGGVVVLS